MILKKNICFSDGDVFLFLVPALTGTKNTAVSAILKPHIDLGES